VRKNIVGPSLDFVSSHCFFLIVSTVAFTFVVVFIAGRPRRRRWLLSLLGAELLPLVCETVCLTVMRWPFRVVTSPAAGITAFILSVAMGLVCVAYFPIRVWLRILAGAIYLPAMTLFLFVYSMFFVARVLHDPQFGF